jgi:hypothetical protein
VILVNPCFIHVHDIIPCFPKRFDLSQIITPIIDILNSKISEFYLELGVLTKNVTVMLLIVLAEAALR